MARIGGNGPQRLGDRPGRTGHRRRALFQAATAIEALIRTLTDATERNHQGLDNRLILPAVDGTATPWSRPVPPAGHSRSRWATYSPTVARSHLCSKG